MDREARWLGLDDLAAIDAFGVRRDAYTQIEVPTVLLGADRTPAHPGDRIDALARTLPHAEKEVQHKRGHRPPARPRDVADVIRSLAVKVLH